MTLIDANGRMIDTTLTYSRVPAVFNKRENGSMINSSSLCLRKIDRG